jgi:dTDP-4-amino-4,6-dideoxygalactose transaminase
VRPGDVNESNGTRPARAIRPDQWPSHRLPYSEATRDEVILLPLYPGMVDEEQDYVIDQIRRLAAARGTG